MSDTDALTTLIDAAGDHARRVMIGTKKELMPVFLLVAGNGDRIIVGTPFVNDDDKDRAAHVVRGLIREHHVARYSFLSEGWRAVQPPGWEHGQPIGLMPSQRPDRQECVIAFATDGINTVWRSWATHRDAEGNCTALTLEPEGMSMTSRFANLLGGEA
jgi:hypothetical protein